MTDESPDPVEKIAAWVPMSNEMMEDMDFTRNEIVFRAESGFNQMIMSGFRRMLFPWEFPDPIVMPKFVLTPRLDWWVDLPSQMKDWYAIRRKRIRTAIGVLRGREYEGDSYYSD